MQLKRTIPGSKSQCREEERNERSQNGEESSTGERTSNTRSKRMSKRVERFGTTFRRISNMCQAYAAMSCDMCLLGWSVASK